MVRKKSQHQIADIRPLKKSSSCSTIYLDDSTVSQPNLKNTVKCVALAIYYHIKNRTSQRQIEIFDEKLHPLTVRANGNKLKFWKAKQVLLLKIIFCKKATIKILIFILDKRTLNIHLSSKFLKFLNLICSKCSSYVRIRLYILLISLNFITLLERWCGRGLR